MPEQKLEVPKHDVKLDEKGNIIINDPKLIEQLRAKGVTKTSDLEKPAISVGVVVSW
jgi:hypothetical protein